MSADTSPPPSGLAVPIRIPAPLARIRRRWDRAARAGAQPHVTVLYPFLPVPALTPAVRSALAGIAAGIEPFDVTFRTVRRFDDGLVWIEPEPAEPFHRLTAAVAACWPDHPPYGGIFDEVVAHLTVAEADEPVALAEAEAAARRALPLTARADRLELWRQDDERRWHPYWRIRLGAPP